MGHSILAPSSAHIWGKPDGCPGYVTMAQIYPETERSQDALEGDASHEIAAMLINGAARGGVSTPTRESLVGAKASNGVIYSDEMFDAAEIYANDVIEIMRSYGVFGGNHFMVESPVHAPRRIHEQSYGTLDAAIFARPNARLYLWDYKFGYEVVEAFENWQGINYLAGIFDKFDVSGMEDQHLTIHFRIAQPRAFHREGPIREWVINGADLRTYFNILQSNAEIALGPNSFTRSGPHCKRCSARHSCEAALTGGMRLYEAAALPFPQELSPQALGVQYLLVKRARKQLEYLETGLDERVKATIRSGVSVPGAITENTFGNQKWNRPISEILSLGEMVGVDLKKEAAITPKQAISKGVDEKLVRQFSETPKTGIKVVPDEGKAKKVFSK